MGSITCKTEIFGIETVIRDTNSKDIYHQLLHQWLEAFKPEGDGLIVGLDHKDARDGFNAKNYMEKKYNVKAFMVDLMSADVNWDITKPWVGEEKKYNWVINQAVLEHTTNPIAAIKNMAEVMTFGAFMYVHVPGPEFPTHNHPIDCFRFMPHIFMAWEKESDDLHLIDSLWTKRHVFALYRKSINVTTTKDEIKKKAKLRGEELKRQTELAKNKEVVLPPNITIRHPVTMYRNFPPEVRTDNEGYAFRTPEYMDYHKDRIKPTGETTAIRRKLKKKFCITIYSYSRQMKYLIKCLHSVKPLDFYTLLAYDNHHNFPDDIVLPHCDAVVIKHTAHPNLTEDKLGQTGAHHSYMWHTLYSLPIIESFGFEYIFHMSGDCAIDKPQGFKDVVKLMGSHDMIAFWHYGPPQRPHLMSIGTMAWIVKTTSFRKMVDYACANWYKPELSGGNVERKLGVAAYELGFTMANPMKHPFDFRIDPGQAELHTDFIKLLGLRHLQNEDQLAAKEEQRLKVVAIKKKERENELKKRSG